MVWSKKHLNSGFVSYTLHKTLTDGLEWCGLLWCFYQQFGLSFWRHPFTAEDPLLSKWWNATFLQIWWKKQTHLYLGWPKGGTHFQQIFIFEWTIPLYPFKIHLISDIYLFIITLFRVQIGGYFSFTAIFQMRFCNAIWYCIQEIFMTSSLSLSLSSPSPSPPLTHQYVPTFPLQSVGHMNPPPPFCSGLPPIPPLPLSLSLSLGKYCLIPLSLSLSPSIGLIHSLSPAACHRTPFTFPIHSSDFFPPWCFRDFLNSSVPGLSLLTSSLSIVIFQYFSSLSSSTLVCFTCSPVHGHTHTNNSSEIIYEFLQRNKGRKCYEFWQSKTLMLLSELWKKWWETWVHNEISDFWLQTILAHLSTV